MGRQLRSHLSLLHPDFAIRDKDSNKPQSQKDHHDSHANRQHFIGDTVFVRNFPTGNKWLPGTVTQNKGPLSFLILMMVMPSATTLTMFENTPFNKHSNFNSPFT